VDQLIRQAAMDHLLANSEKPIPEADEDDEEAIQSLESGEEAKVSSFQHFHCSDKARADE
jgi:hypothetical protein